jgi:hypothetical protein
MTPEDIAQLEQSDSPDARQMGREMRERWEYRERLLQEKRDAGDWEALLSLADSQERATVLVEALSAVESKEAYTHLFREWFNSCDALAPQREQLRAYLDETDFFTDELGAENTPDLPVVVYRGAWDDDEAERGLSWTVDREVAERFARGLVGPRARFVLGIYREDGTPTIFRAIATEAYGFLNDRGEKEVIAKKLRAVEQISVLVRADG